MGDLTPSLPVLNHRRVLIIDDDQDARSLLQHVLESRQMQVLEAARVAEAMEVLSTENVDAIVCDITMPDEDGYAFIQRVRLMPSCRETPAVALTALGRHEDRMRALASGFDKHMTKPLDVNALVVMLADLLNPVSSYRE